MKFLTRKYRESMRSWFGKAGNGKHVSCVILRDETTSHNTDDNTNDASVEKLRKRTYITFISKALQDVGSIMAIFQSVLKQRKVDFPHIKYIIDKSNNARCYHNEILFTWKVL